MSVEVTKLDTGLTVVTDSMAHLETAALGVWAGVGANALTPVLTTGVRLLTYVLDVATST